MQPHTRLPLASLWLSSTLALAGCTQLSLGQCNSTADCKAGTTCDTTQSPPVCVIEPGTCFPACPSGEACHAGVCVAQGCTPACTANQVCDPDGGVCVSVNQPQIDITSPATNTFVGQSLTATADAVAPSGVTVTAVNFELDKDGQPIAQGAATHTPTSADPANWAGGVSLASLDGSADGPAQLVAIATTSAGVSTDSPAVTVQIDLTPPVISMITDGRAALYPGGAMVQIQAQLLDTGSGFLPGAQATLEFTSVAHMAVTGPVSNGVATFAVALDDTLAPPLDNTTITFSITATDAVGNSATLSGDPKQVIRVDRQPPAGAITPVTPWNSQVAVVQLSGSITDPGGSISGGLAAVQLTHGGAIVGTATISTSSDTVGTWTGTIDLAAQTFAAGFEGPWDYTARFVDAVGNSSTADSTLLVDDGPPQIAAVQVLTQPSGEAGDGGNLYAGPNLAITARISDGSGVAGARLAFQGQSPVAGTTLDGGAWSFSVPRPTGTYDGVAIPFSISASDPFADAGLPQAAAAVHTATVSEPGLIFDNVPPAIAIAANNSWYVRALPDGGAAVLEIDATITDGSGLAGTPALTPQGGSPITGTAGSGGLYKFFLDPAQSFPAGDAGPLAFTVAAQDLAGNVGSASGSRNIDGSGPTLNALSINLAGASPDAGVQYPAAISNTGHDGAHFIYNDTVTISATVADPAGLQSVALQINGALADGGEIAGTPIPISCGAGNSCAVSQTLALNAPGNGALNSPFVDGGLPAADLSLALIATGKALLPDGGAANQPSSVEPTPIAVTRYLWRQALPHVLNTASGTSPSGVGAGIVGIAIHPDGDLIVAGNSDGTKNADTIFAVRSSGPLADGGANLDWSWGGTGGAAGASVGSPADSPALGEGDASSALIYAGTSGGYFTALQPDGGVQWQFAPASMTFALAPAVIEAIVSQGNNGPAQPVEAVIASADPSASAPAGTESTLYGLYLLPGQSAPSGGGGAALPASPGACNPSLVNGTLWLGTTVGTLYEYTLTAAGDLTLLNHYGSNGPPFLEPITDNGGFDLFETSANAAAQGILEVDLNDAVNSPMLPLIPNVTAPPVLDASGNLYVSTGVSTGADNFYSLQTAPPGTPQLLATLSAPGFTAVAGSNGHVYLPFDSGDLFAFKNGAVSWSFSRDRKISPMATIDCQGILYVGSGSSLYAFVTDDQGLADSGWPQHRRDARASGNSSAPKYGIRSAGVCTQ